MEKTPTTINREDYIFVTEEMSKNSNIYPIMDVQCCPMDREQVPDIASAGYRNKRYGAVISISCVPNYDKQPNPLIIQAGAPAMLVDADTIEELEKRINAEIKGTLKLYQDVQEGNVTFGNEQEQSSGARQTEASRN